MYLEIEVFVFNPSMFVSIRFLIKKLHLILKVVQLNKVSALCPCTIYILHVVILWSGASVYSKHTKVFLQTD